MRERAGRGGWVAATAALLAMCACHHSPPAPDGGPTPQCETRADCDAGYVCTSNLFCANCTSSGQCALKELCDPTKQLCVFRPGWGNQCQLNSQCQAGQWCSQGLCLARDNVQLCPSGASSDCPSGLRCNAINFVCEQDLGCLANDDCDPGEVCNPGSHVCVPMCTPATQSTVCTANQSCADGGLCVECTKASDCGVGLICDAAGNCGTGSRCYTDRDCTVPLVCYALTGQCVPRLPPCVSDENCGVTQRCDLGTGNCVPRQCQPDRFEPNNTPDAAYPVTAGDYQALTLCNGETDYFALELSRGDELGVNVNADPFAEQTFTTSISNAGGLTLASGHLLASYVAPANATYYVGISSTDANETYDVTFLLSRGTPCDEDPYEPNDTPQEAWPLNATTTVDATICPGDSDYWAVPVPVGKGITVSLVNYLSQNGLLQLCLFAPASGDAGSTQIGCSSDLTSPAVIGTAAQLGGQTALVQVQGGSSLVTNSYTLQVAFQ
jgi:hypothetical protein